MPETQPALPGLSLTAGGPKGLDSQQGEGPLFQNPSLSCDLSARPPTQESENSQCTRSSVLTRFPKGMGHERALTKGPRNHRRRLRGPVSSRLWNCCLGAGGSSRHCWVFRLADSCKNLPHRWHQLTMTQRGVVNKETLRSQNRIFQLACLALLCRGFRSSVTANRC